MSGEICEKHEYDNEIEFCSSPDDYIIIIADVFVVVGTRVLELV